MVIEALSTAAFLLSVAALISALRESSPRLDTIRWLCLALTGCLLAAGLIGVVAAWTLVLSCLGFLIALPAVAIASYAEHETVEEKPVELVHDEPAWWPEFERDFQRYARRASERRGTAVQDPTEEAP
jgi:hypothetical protein